jgi:hypothetical protein
MEGGTSKLQSSEIQKHSFLDSQENRKMHRTLSGASTVQKKNSQSERIDAASTQDAHHATPWLIAA